MPDLRAIDPARLAAIGHAIGGRREPFSRRAPAERVDAWPRR
jgi:hypothetical protein